MYDEVPGEYWGYEPNGRLELIIVIAIVATALAVWALTRRSRHSVETRRRTEAVESIYDSINAAARTAAGAVGPAAPFAAQLLVDEIKARLGAVLDLARPLGKHVNELEEALKGPVKAPEPPKPRPVVCTCACTCGCVDADGKAKAGEHGQSQSQVNILTSGSVIVAPPAPPAPPPPGGDKTAVDQQKAVRWAAGEFAQYWGAKDARVRELKAAQTALLTPAPKKPATGSQKHG